MAALMQQVVGWRNSRLWLLAALVGIAGCGGRAKVEMIYGEPGEMDAELVILDVRSSSNEHSVQGVRLLNLEKWEAAADAFQLALAENPKCHKSAFGLGVAREMQGNAEEALALYEQAYQDSGDARYLEHCTRLRKSDFAR